jgi:hypothetical protein
MDRPALQQLLADITAGRVDTVIVYKIDRLTRSLADFAKIVEILDARGASFVSGGARSGGALETAAFTIPLRPHARLRRRDRRPPEPRPEHGYAHTSLAMSVRGLTG